MVSSRRSIGAWVFTFILVGFTALGWFQRQALFDWIRLRNYQPAARVVQLANDTTMNSQARHLFYVYHPELDSRQNFSQHCPDKGEKTIVLGCYINPKGIYLFEVTDPRLAGVLEVTAAHETLHAAYDRLGGSDKANVDALINQAYINVSDQRIRDTISSYQKAGADITNELHSILGTEVRNLPPALETYYARYFTDRNKIVGFSESYEKVFTDRQAAADGYRARMNDIEAQLKGLKPEIDNLENSLSNQYPSLEQERHTTSDAAGFNAKVVAYNSQVNLYKNKVDTYNQLVKEHNVLLDKYNAIALEENELIKAINSRPDTVQAQ